MANYLSTLNKVLESLQLQLKEKSETLQLKEKEIRSFCNRFESLQEDNHWLQKAKLVVAKEVEILQAKNEAFVQQSKLMATLENQVGELRMDISAKKPKYKLSQQKTRRWKLKSNFCIWVRRQQPIQIIFPRKMANQKNLITRNNTISKTKNLLQPRSWHKLAFW